jgi:putative colanic acid biosynthesis glycosyltransferase WcaI
LVRPSKSLPVFQLPQSNICQSFPRQLQRSEDLANVTLIEPVPQSELVDFLSAADLWIIPYRRKTTGVSVPSRFYNLLAVGRLVIVAAEPDSEAALLAQEEDVGWVVSPEDAAQLANHSSGGARSRWNNAEGPTRGKTGREIW